MGETKTTVIRLTKVADELLNFARLHREAYDELCEAAAQIIEAKKKMAKHSAQKKKTLCAIC